MEGTPEFTWPSHLAHGCPRRCGILSNLHVLTALKRFDILVGSSSGLLPRGSGPRRVPWSPHLFSPGAGGGWHLPEPPGKEPPQPVQGPRMVSLQVPHLVGYHGEQLLRAQPGEKCCRDGKSRPAEPRGEVCGVQEPQRPRPLCARPALEPLRGHRGDRRHWAPGAVLSGPPLPPPCPAILVREH